ncbi:MAG TPA: hypothetical protein VN832_10610 [Stellaceae bacterium]|nr:hypothetical protein [Stellaceae bacterium]
MRAELPAAVAKLDRTTKLLLLLLPCIAIYYALPLATHREELLLPAIRGFTFNSMLDHLLHGRFDVDAAVIGDEGFIRDGRTYTYFGIFPALLRLPLLWSGRLGSVDITWTSTLAAVVFGAFCKLRAIAAVQRQLPETGWTTTVFLALVVSIALGEAQIQFLRPSIYQEVVSWAAGLAAAFVYYAVRGLLVEREFGARLLTPMAILAGLALLTRVTFGVGLYLALGFLVLTIAWPADRRPILSRAGVLIRRLLAPDCLCAGAILLLFAALCGLVNYGRFGNPLVFADIHLHIIDQIRYPDRIQRLDRYGEFNLARLWFGLQYYWLPLWAIIRPDGQFLFHEFQQRMVDANEMPPSSFFVSDPLLILLCLMFLRALWRKQWAGTALQLLPRRSLALLAGFGGQILLILIASSMSFRYRMEFYPCLELAAFLGFYAICAADAPSPMTEHPILSRLVWPSALWSVIAAQLLMILYRSSEFGPASVVLHLGWFGFYHARMLNLPMQ